LGTDFKGKYLPLCTASYLKKNLKKNLHIVTLNTPYPADYGGMIDCFHRIRSLYNIGIGIRLHVFEYGRSQSRELESFCNSVNYYPRNTSFHKHLSFLPYSVFSRNSGELLENLLKYDHPVLFDGIQTTLYLDHPALSERKKAVRIHNIEHNYYHTLVQFEKKFIKKLYYKIESVKLKRYENILEKADIIFPISDPDQEHFNQKFHNSVLIPPFHPFDSTECSTGTGDYILYHGDLSVNENVAVSEFLISNVFSKIPFRCIIAGKNPPEKLSARIAPHNNINLIPNPDNEIMTNLIRDAHINILPAMAANGFKLKLLLSLFSGRHCLVNSATVKGSGLDTLCHVADSAEEMIRMIHSLIALPFSEEMISERERILSKNNNNINNAEKLMKSIFSD